MSTSFDIEVAFYAPDGTPRDCDPDAIAPGVQWELLEQGGLGQATIPLAIGFDAADLDVLGGDTVEIWAVGEATPRYIGTVGQPERTLGTTEGWSLICYGPMQDMDRVRLRTSLQHDGGADLATYAEEIIDLYAAKRPDLVFTTDFQTTNFNALEQLDLTDATPRQGMDKLYEQASGGVVWGWDVDPSTRGLRCYIRPRVSDVGYEFPVGESVRAISDATEYTGIINRAAPLKGGTAQFPNLLAAAVNGNTPLNAVQQHPFSLYSGTNATSSNEFAYGMETLSLGWTGSGGAASEDAGATYGAARTGRKILSLPALSASATQSFSTAYHWWGEDGTRGNAYEFQTFAIRPGSKYRIGIWARLLDSSHTSAGTITLNWLDSGGSTISTVTIAVTPNSQSLWEEFYAYAVVPTGTVGISYTIACTTYAGAALLLNDAYCTLSLAALPGWELYVQKGVSTTSLIVDRDAAYPDPAGGSTCLYVNVQTNDVDNEDISLRPRGGARFTVAPSAHNRDVVYIMSPPGATSTPKLILQILLYKADGSYITVEKTIRDAAASPITSWTPIAVDIVTTTDTASWLSSLVFRSDGELLIKNYSSRDVAAAIDDFIPADQFERFVAAEDVVPTASLAYDSYSTYGAQEDIVNAPDIVAWDANAQAYMQAFFLKYALPIRRPRLELDDEQFQILTPGSGTTVRITGLDEEFGDLWPASVTYTWNGKLSISAPLGNPEPSLDRILAGQQAQITAGGGGGVTASGASGSSSSSSTGDGIPVPVPIDLGGTGASSATAARAALLPAGIFTGTISLAPLTTGGTAGSLTFTDGVLTGAVSST